VSSPGNAELGEFLRTRWSHMDPGKAGIPESTRRRVPGLRRQELARLASISPDYYTQLEQGRHPTVLDALARALLLSADERAHLYALAQAVDPDPPPPTFLPGGSAQMPTG
jgi:transcriptional regulator with XRE-family HTH domain